MRFHCDWYALPFIDSAGRGARPTGDRCRVRADAVTGPRGVVGLRNGIVK